MKLPAFLARFIASERKQMSAVPSTGGWFGVIRESFAGAFQSVLQVDAPRNILAFSAVFSCVTLIASDIAKLAVRLVVEGSDGICAPAPTASPYWTSLRRPNKYQNWLQFIEQWVISKLLYGNTYVLKVRKDLRGLVTHLHVLDSQRVTPLVTEQGDVYYQISADHLAGIIQTITVPASEIIHDRINCLWHPLVGISPIYACGASATIGNRIQSNSGHFFQNMSRPSGMLTAPGSIDDETAERLKKQFEENYSQGGMGRVAVGGNGLEYKPMMMTAVDAEVIAQLRWSVEDVARAFHMPLYKIGAETGRSSGNLSVEAQAQQYLDDCLQIHIESIESCLDDGLELPTGYHAELDEDGLLRMDKAALFEALGTGVGKAILAPNEARARLGLAPVAGGDSPLAQQQNFSLAALAKRDAKDDPFATNSPASVPSQSNAQPPDTGDAAKKFLEDLKGDVKLFTKELECQI